MNKEFKDYITECIKHFEENVYYETKNNVPEGVEGRLVFSCTKEVIENIKDKLKYYMNKENCL